MGNLKKFVIKTSIFCFLAFGIVGCDGCKEKSKSEPVPEEGEDVSKILEEPGGIIQRTEANQLYRAYQTFRVGLIEEFENSGAREKMKGPYDPKRTQNTTDTSSDRKEFMAAQYVSFEYDSIKKYLRYIEQEAELSGEKISGLRFYFANYPDQREFEDGETVKHPKQNSIMISPTINRNGRDSIFYTVDTENGKRKAIAVGDDFRDRKAHPVPKKDEQGAYSRTVTKNIAEASLMPDFSIAPNPPVFSERSTTYNRGNGSPPNSN